MCISLIRFLRTRGKIKSLDGASPETKALVRQTDQSTQIFVATGPESFIGKNENSPSDADIKTDEITNVGWKKNGDAFTDWEKSRIQHMTVHVTENFVIDVNKADYFYGKYGLFDKLFKRFINSGLLYPLNDKILFCESDEQAATLMKECKFTEALPESYHHWDDLLTDENFSRIFFNGIGVVLLDGADGGSDELGPFLVDMPLQNLQVRKGFRPYGARVHFDQSQTATAIFDYHKKKLYKPGDEGWERAKYVAKSTMILQVTAREHLVYGHLLVANSTSRQVTKTLPPSHPIRRLLTIFVFRTDHVNFDAINTLVPKRSFLHRGTALTYESMKNVFDSSFKASNIFQPFPEREVHPALSKLCEEGKLPFVSEGIAYFEIVRNFVKEWLTAAGDAASDSFAKNFYSGMKETTKGQKYELPPFEAKDSMLNMVSQIIFTVTAWHELVGGVVDYISLPTQTGFRIVDEEDKIQTDVQSFLTMAVVGASTSLRMPFLMRKFENFFGVDGAPSWERSVWDDFQRELEKQSKAVQEADAARSTEFKSFDPARFECSISV